MKLRKRAVLLYSSFLHAFFRDCLCEERGLGIAVSRGLLPEARQSAGEVRRLALNRTAGGHRALNLLGEQAVDNDGRQGSDDHGGAHGPPVGGELALEEEHAQREGLHVGRGAHQHVGQQELIPSRQEHVDRDGHGRRTDERHDDQEERLPDIGAVDTGGLFHLLGDALEEAVIHHAGESQVDRRIRQDQGPVGIHHVQGGNGLNDRQQDRLNRNELTGGDQRTRALAALPVEAGDSKGEHHRADDRQDNGARADDHTVLEIQRHVVLIPGVYVVFKTPDLGQAERIGLEDFRIVLEGIHDHPEHRVEREDRISPQEYREQHGRKAVRLALLAISRILLGLAHTRSAPFLRANSGVSRSLNSQLSTRMMTRHSSTSTEAEVRP